MRIGRELDSTDLFVTGDVSGVEFTAVAFSRRLTFQASRKILHAPSSDALAADCGVWNGSALHLHGRHRRSSRHQRYLQLAVETPPTQLFFTAFLMAQLRARDASPSVTVITIGSSADRVGLGQAWRGMAVSRLNIFLGFTVSRCPSGDNRHPRIWSTTNSGVSAGCHPAAFPVLHPFSDWWRFQPAAQQLQALTSLPRPGAMMAAYPTNDRPAHLVEAGKEPEQDHLPDVFLYGIEDPSRVIANRDAPLIKLRVILLMGISSGVRQ